MRTLIAAAVVAVFAAGATGRDDTKYESKEGKYAIAFPGKPTIQTGKAGDIALSTAIVEKATLAYTVTHADLPADLVKLSKPKDILASAEAGLVKSFKAKLISSKEVEFAAQKYPAREVVAEKEGTTIRLLIVLVDNRLYQVYVVGPKDTTASKDADAFFASFEIMK